MREKDRAKKWFLETEVSVLLTHRITDPIQFPAVSVSLESSTQDFSTLGDINYEPNDVVNSNSFISVIGPITGNYTPATGVLLINNPNRTPITPNMQVLDLATNKTYPIRDITLGTGTQLQLILDTNLNVNFKSISIIPPSQLLNVSLESALFRETYTIQSAVVGEPESAIWLHSVLMFCMLRYKQNYLEARGFTSTTISTGPLEKLPTGEENIFGRSITISGFVRHSWPKYISQQSSGIIFQPSIASPTNPTSTIDAVNAPWVIIPNSNSK